LCKSNLYRNLFLVILTDERGSQALLLLPPYVACCLVAYLKAA
jgi:hypothetical protein